MYRRVLLRMGDFLFVLRPLILIPVWSFYILGGHAAAGPRRYNLEFIYGLICLTAIMATAYLINQIFDIDTDRENEKVRYLSDGIFRTRTVVIMAVFYFLVASWAFQKVHDAQRLPLAGALVLSLVYSLPPIRLCSRPWLDLIANAIGYGGLAFVAAFGALRAPVPDGLLRAIPFVLLVGATFLHTTILDIDGDRGTGKITTSVRIGAGWSAFLATILSGAALGVALGLSLRAFGDWMAPIVCAASLVTFMTGYVKIRRAVERHDDVSGISSAVVQIVTALVALTAAAIEPLFLLLIVPLVLIARAYYRARFSMQYPGPGEASSTVDAL